jgi:hypothetical protein
MYRRNQYRINNLWDFAHADGANPVKLAQTLQRDKKLGFLPIYYPGAIDVESCSNASEEWL